VELSPSADLERSDDRPGAKTPRPYPRIATHHGSLCVSLDDGKRQIHHSHVRPRRMKSKRSKRPKGRPPAHVERSALAARTRADAGDRWRSVSRSERLNHGEKNPPMLHAIAEGFKAHLRMPSVIMLGGNKIGSTHPRVAGEVLDNLLLVQPAAVAVMKVLGKIPMVQRLEK
jgi:hypothetical protein